MFSIQNISVHFGGTPLFRNVSFIINQKDRIGLAGKNGSGKTTLISLHTQKLQPVCGHITCNDIRIGIIDQKYGLIAPDLTVLENIRQRAHSDIKEHELRIRLGRFLFYKDEVFKQARDLSGGEKCRLSLACLLAVSNEPDLIILDEPTNNLDLAGIEQMQSALQQYSGALLVISHDQIFLETLGIDKVLDLNKFR